MTVASTLGPRLSRVAILALLALTTAAGSRAAPRPDDAGFAKQPDSVRVAARFDYLLHCSGCHLPDGAGSPPEVPPLRGTMGLLVATPEGRVYIARVPEVAQSPLDDEALARVLNWVLLEFNAETLPRGFQALTGDEVGVARTRVLADPLRARAAILGSYDSQTSGQGRRRSSKLP